MLGVLLRTQIETHDQNAIKICTFGGGIPNWPSSLGWKLKQRLNCVDSKKENKLEQTTRSIAHISEQCGLL